MSFRLVLKSVTLNDLERRNGIIFALFQRIRKLPGALRKSSRSLCHLLMSSCYTLLPCIMVNKDVGLLYSPVRHWPEWPPAKTYGGRAKLD